MTTKEILRIVPTLQAAALLQNNVRLLKKKRRTAGDFISTGIGNVIGAAFIAEESNLIEGL